MNILTSENDANMKEITEFVETLPCAIKTKLNKHIYRKTYKKLNFLKNKSDYFITWVCPLLKSMTFTYESYVYYENDQIDFIYYMC